MKKHVTWAFAVAFKDQIHIIPHEMPTAENLVNVRLLDNDGMWVIDAVDAVELRKLLGVQSIKEVVRHVGPDVADELEDLLDGIVRLVDRRVSQLRHEDEVRHILDDVIPDVPPNEGDELHDDDDLPEPP